MSGMRGLFSHGAALEVARPGRLVSRDEPGEMAERSCFAGTGTGGGFSAWGSELPERFGTEVHALVLMDNHHHLLARCRRTDLSETLRWPQTAYAMWFNRAYRRRGHMFQGRFKSVLIREERSLDAVARCFHPNGYPVCGPRG